MKCTARGFATYFGCGSEGSRDLNTHHASRRYCLGVVIRIESYGTGKAERRCRLVNSRGQRRTAEIRRGGSRLIFVFERRAWPRSAA